jgi:hypothetical protein
MDLQIFQWGSFSFVFFYAFSWSSREGVLLIFKRGGLKNDFARRGGSFIKSTPLLYFTRFPPLREII